MKKVVFSKKVCAFFVCIGAVMMNLELLGISKNEFFINVGKVVMLLSSFYLVFLTFLKDGVE